MMKMFKILLPFTLFTGLLFSQSIEGNWQLGAVIVEYTYVVRDSASAEDATAVYDVTGSWPSSAAPAYTHSLKSYDIGDTIAVALVPLVTPALLDSFGVVMNVNLNDDGTFTINEGSIYPTTETLNCSTFATFPAVEEAGTWIGTPGYDHVDDPNHPYAHSRGWGISLSEVFAQFSAPDLVGGTYGVDYGVGTDMENWGMVTVDYTDDSHQTPAGLEIYWEAHDGAASGLGVDSTASELNGVTGIPVAPADTVTISNMDDYLYYYENDLWESLGWTGEDNLSVPMLGGSGQPIDPTNPDSYEVDPATGDTTGAGQVAANWGYIFDPMGSDDTLFNGDEPLAPTGYFFTYNFLEAAGIFPAVMNAQMGVIGLEGALAAAADSVAILYVDAATSAYIGTQVSSSLFAEYNACFPVGGAACAAIFQKGPTASLLGVRQACDDTCGVDDSGWDYDPTDGTGRLIFEIDNNCIPDNTTQRVRTFWGNTQLEVDEEAPLAQKFEVYGNYPNPFNPSTQIKFATEKSSDVTITIYSILGQEMTVLQNGILNAGTYNISWFGTDRYGNKVPSGVYFYEVRSDNRIQKGKMLLLK
ncbi:MAG: T9SS type A sorting domain-containing protein [Candidatus Marinimicrobia bacterium]|nr:T9SS type A sorting domain-containing protein [Candidatus Neomarinimicrobiota bacterium]